MRQSLVDSVRCIPMLGQVADSDADQDLARLSVQQSQDRSVGDDSAG
jgi:hypothetical protein